MSELRELLEEVLDQELIRMTLSDTTDAAQGEKLKVRPVLIRGELYFQETLYRDKKVFHTNYRKEEMMRRLEACLEGEKLFRQAQIECETMDAAVLVSKKGAVSVKKKKKKETAPQAGQAGQSGAACPRRLDHDRAKQYILPEGQPVDFLVELGVQSSDGRIIKARYDKFRQINRYL